MSSGTVALDPSVRDYADTSPASLASFSTDVAPHEDGGRLGVCVEEHASPIILESNTTVESNNRILESPGESLRSPLLQRAEPM